MTHAAGHIICGTGGTQLPEKQIWVYDGALSVAIKIDVNELEAQAVAAGMDPEKVQKRVDRFVAMVENHWHEWGEYLEDKLCIEYTRHEPHPQNFD